MDVLVGQFLWALATSRYVPHVQNYFVVSHQIQQYRTLPHDHVPFFKGVFEGVNPLVDGVLKVAAELVALFFAFVVEFDCKIMELLFHVPGDVFGDNFFDVFEAEEVEGKYLLGGLGVLVFGFEFLEEAFVGIDFVEVFVILKWGFSDSEKFAPEGADTWVINWFSLIVIAVPEILQIYKLNVLEFLVDLVFIFVLLLFFNSVVDTVFIFDVTMDKGEPGVDLIHLGVSIVCYDLLVLCTPVVCRQNLRLNLQRFHILPIYILFA